MTDSITKSKKLHSGRPVWQAYGHSEVSCLKLKKDQVADVVVIGAGISGAMMAEELSEAGFSVIILDKRKPFQGSTAATTALLLYEIDTPLIKLQKEIGIEKAIRAWRRSKLGLDNIIEKIRKNNIQCQMKSRPSVYLAGDDLDASGLEKESSLRNSLGITTGFLSKRELRDRYLIKREAALESYSAIEVNPVQLAKIEVNPVQLANELMRKAISRGVKLYSPVIVSDVETTARQVRVQIEAGPVIKAKYAIFSTGYEIPKQIHTKKHKIFSTWVFATKPQKFLWPEKSFIWEASTPYLYLRTTVDKRVICGGEDEEFSNEEKRDALTEQKIAMLQKKLLKIFPHLDVTADYAWAGAFGSSATGLPSIGEIPDMPNCFSVMGYGGNGITFSKIASELIRSKLTGLDDPDQSLFDFSRK